MGEPTGGHEQVAGGLDGPEIGPERIPNMALWVVPFDHDDRVLAGQPRRLGPVAVLQRLLADQVFPADLRGRLEVVAELVVTESTVEPRLPARPPRLLLDRIDDLTAQVNGDTAGFTADTLVYVIYTSGSTGRPKGVMMTQRPLLRMLDWQLTRSRVHSPTLQFASISFDVSFQELFSTWLAGGTVVLVDLVPGHSTTGIMRRSAESTS